LPRIIKIEGKINESDIKKRVKEEIIRENTESLLQNKDDRKSLHLASHVCSTNIEKNARIKTNSKNESYKK
jgi:Tfp pilus assembly pilus retraction ATPase PilT